MSRSLAARMLAASPSIASAMASSREFFCAVVSSATLAAAARASSRRSRVLTGLFTVVATLVCLLSRRKVRSDLAFECTFNRPRMPSVNDGDVHACFARRLGCAQLGAHAARPKLALAVAEILHLGSELVDCSQQTRSLAP